MVSTTDDFRATARLSGGTGEASTFKQLLEITGKQSKGSIDELNLIGHAGFLEITLGHATISGGVTFALGGLVHDGTVDFTPGAMISASSIKANLDTIKAVRDRFNNQVTFARITLYACNAGISSQLLEELSKAFQLTVRGFRNQIFWCFTPTGRTTAKRGKTFYDASGMEVHPDCDSFSPDVRRWIPESFSFGGQIDL